MHVTSTLRVWFITGASKGFGLEIDRVALATPPDQLLALDVTNEQQSVSAVAQSVERFGQLDVLVNNPSCGLLGAVKEASDAETQAVFETNVFGLSRAGTPDRHQYRGSGSAFQFSSLLISLPMLSRGADHQVVRRGDNS